MCGRYIFLDERNVKLRELAERAKKKLPKDIYDQISLFDVFPGTKAFTAIFDQKKKNNQYTVMSWGLHLKTKLVINARSETFLTSPFFKDCIPCVIPCSAYYEHDANNTKYAFYTEDDTCYLAGLYRVEEDGYHFVILTEEADPEACHIHPRQPVMFTYEDAKKWIASDQSTSLIKNSIHKRFSRKA